MGGEECYVGKVLTSKGTNKKSNGERYLTTSSSDCYTCKFLVDLRVKFLVESKPTDRRRNLTPHSFRTSTFSHAHKTDRIARLLLFGARCPKRIIQLQLGELLVKPDTVQVEENVDEALGVGLGEPHTLTTSACFL